MKSLEGVYEDGGPQWRSIVDGVRRGDLRSVELAVRFLELDRRYFRSGYQKEVISKCLGRVELSPDQRLRIEHAARIALDDTKRPGREKRAWFRILAQVKSEIEE